ncbi:hypothetical protein A2U01_0095060, partial [Trifolium medium]|nr:hypothetical protein [Trifolium medium]
MVAQMKHHDGEEARRQISGDDITMFRHGSTAAVFCRNREEEEDCNIEEG